MSTKLLTATAVIGGALLLSGASFAAPLISSTISLDRDVQLVRSGGGGGGGHVGGGGGGGGGGHVGGGGGRVGGGGAAHVGGGRVGGGHLSSGHLSSGRLSTGRVTSGRAVGRAHVAPRGGAYGSKAYAARRGNNHATAKRHDDKSGRNRYANRNWDHSWDNHNNWRHRRYYGGVYAYTPWLYSNADCGWLYQRAIATGSTYWWSRYDACVY